jgi:hypothetical protein
MTPFSIGTDENCDCPNSKLTYLLLLCKAMRTAATEVPMLLYLFFLV